ncbi:hypothetical protein N2152v2_006016 [Parachlorella kessleri]
MAHTRPFVPCQGAGRRLQVVARQGGGYGSGPSFGDRPGGGPSFGRDPTGRLIMPGNGPQGGPAGRKLVLPGQQGGQRPQPGGGAGGAPSPAFGNFRPPPGFMDAPGKPEAPEATMSVEEMLNRLRSNAGEWHQQAKLLPLLLRAGCDSVAVEEAVGLERRVQNVWIAAEQVYESVKKSGELSGAELAHFDGEGGEELLYELRLLSIKQRTQAAAYIVENDLTPQESLVLARAVKDHERRVGTKEGFSNEMGDCLAYKYYRDAVECRRTEDAEVCIQKGLEVAVSREARTRLASMLSDKEEVEAARPTATLTTLRMTKDELGSRIVVVPGSLQECTAHDLRSAPKAASEGVFGNFRVPSGNHEWVALPSWSVLQLAGHPVALTIPNCADVPEIRASLFAKTEDELKRLSGSGLLLVDLALGSNKISHDDFYLVADGSRLRLQEGINVGSYAEVIGRVLFLCRPPSRDGGLAGSTAELLSL